VVASSGTADVVSSPPVNAGVWDISTDANYYWDANSALWGP
jgi:hypothetical protein